MASIGIFYGSSGGNTEMAAEKIAQSLGDADLHDVATATPSDMQKYDKVIIGSSTWHVGELQDDWEVFIEELDKVDFTGKTLAYFGMGDQVVYSDNYLDAIGMIHERIMDREEGKPEKVIGQWPTDGYEHDNSRAELEDGNFLGLGLDEDNQDELTDERIEQWVDSIKPGFGF